MWPSIELHRMALPGLRLFVGPTSGLFGLKPKVCCTNSIHLVAPEIMQIAIGMVQRNSNAYPLKHSLKMKQRAASRKVQQFGHLRLRKKHFRQN